MSKNIHQNASNILFQRARQLRNKETKAEEILWGYLRTKPLKSKFRRQHPYFQYIFDFYCYALRLVIEVDGTIHLHKENTKKDEERDGFLLKDGLTILRFTNDQIFHELEKVIVIIEIEINKLKGK